MSRQLLGFVQTFIFIDFSKQAGTVHVCVRQSHVYVFNDRKMHRINSADIHVYSKVYTTHMYTCTYISTYMYI